MRILFSFLTSITAVVTLLSLSPIVVPSAATVLAQETMPTSLPAPAPDELIVVAGGHGADLYAADGSYLVHAAAGERLIADRQSADQQWLSVTTPAGQTGWAMRDALLLFERMPLPTANVTIEPAATPTPEPTVAVAAPAMPSDATAPETSDALVSTPADNATMTDNNPTTAMTSTADATVEALVRTGTMRLNIRSGPGTNYPVVAKATAGETLTVVARNRDQQWLQVARAGATTPVGWVATQFVAVTQPLMDLAVADGTIAESSPVSPSTTSVVPAQSSGPVAGLPGKLVFTDRNGGTIYLYHFGSGQLTTLTTGLDPALSPNGQEVVFTRPAGENGIYLIHVDGSNERQIFAGRELLRSPKWSPDGQYIVFSRGDEFNRCYLDKDTGDCLRSAPFNPEGYEQGRDHTYKLARIDRNGENYRDIAVIPEAITPDWIRNGIVYQSGSGLQITQDTPADQNRLLYFDIKLQYHQDPDWQPNGNRIVYQQRQGSHYEIFAINADGSGRTALTRPVTTLVDQLPSNVTPAWSPDGQSIVFLSNRLPNHEAGPWRLWVMNGDGSNQRALPINVDLHYDYSSEQMVDWGP
ncbi:MAG: PD40 domain-containing protein [Caldilineaceae bacterium]|nr:PD40 domain-containing protein [Caldilineaceae bacterium]